MEHRKGNGMGIKKSRGPRCEDGKLVVPISREMLRAVTVSPFLESYPELLGYAQDRSKRRESARHSVTTFAGANLQEGPQIR